jgi:hypothetical protein
MSANLDHSSERLSASRARMRAWMRGEPGDDGKDGAGPRSGPLPLALHLANEAGKQALKPTAERHPVALVGVALAGGALIAWARPWRALLGSAVFAGLASQLGARLVSQIPFASVFDAFQNLAAPAGSEPSPTTCRSKCNPS